MRRDAQRVDNVAGPLPLKVGKRVESVAELAQFRGGAVGTCVAIRRYSAVAVEACVHGIRITRAAGVDGAEPYRSDGAVHRVRFAELDDDLTQPCLRGGRARPFVDSVAAGVGGGSWLPGALSDDVAEHFALTSFSLSR